MKLLKLKCMCYDFKKSINFKMQYTTAMYNIAKLYNRTRFDLKSRKVETNLLYKVTHCMYPLLQLIQHTALTMNWNFVLRFFYFSFFIWKKKNLIKKMQNKTTFHHNAKETSSWYSHHHQHHITRVLALSLHYNRFHIFFVVPSFYFYFYFIRSILERFAYVVQLDADSAAFWCF